MNYLRTYEDFYNLHSPVASFKSNVGTEVDSNAGAETYPYNSFNINDEQEAFKKGQEAFKKGEAMDANPYSDQQYPNPALIKAFEEGWSNAELNKKIK